MEGGIGETLKTGSLTSATGSSTTESESEAVTSDWLPRLIRHPEKRQRHVRKSGKKGKRFMSYAFFVFVSIECRNMSIRAAMDLWISYSSVDWAYRQPIS